MHAVLYACSVKKITIWCVHESFIIYVWTGNALSWIKLLSQDCLSMVCPMEKATLWVCLFVMMSQSKEGLKNEQGPEPVISPVYYTLSHHFTLFICFYLAKL